MRKTMKISVRVFLVLTILGVILHYSDAKRFVKPRIVGGELAREGQFPYIVVVQTNNNANCGGSIISATYVLTAGHCVHLDNGRGARKPPSSMSVRVGSNKLATGGTIHQVAEIKVHPNYAISTSDIALLRMARAIQMTNRVRPIVLSRVTVRAGNAVTVIGWGNTQTRGFMTNDLRYTTVTGMSDEECGRYYARHPSVMCLGHPVGRGICQGDSGGPAVMNGQLVGAMSFTSSDGCGTAIPDGFVRISNVIGWVQQNSR